MYGLEWRAVYAMRSRDGYFGVYFSSWEATRESGSNEGIKHQNTIELVHKEFVTTAHIIILFLTRQHGPIYDNQEDNFSHIQIMSHLLWLRSGDDATINSVAVVMTWHLWRAHIKGDI